MENCLLWPEGRLEIPHSDPARPRADIQQCPVLHAVPCCATVRAAAAWLPGVSLRQKLFTLSRCLQSWHVMEPLRDCEHAAVCCKGSSLDGHKAPTRFVDEFAEAGFLAMFHCLDALRLTLLALFFCEEVGSGNPARDV